MTSAREHKGPKGQRFLILSLNIFLGLLVYWLLGFVTDDIGNQSGPLLTDVQKQYQDQAMVKQKESLQHRYELLTQQLESQNKQQELLQTSIKGYRDTMNQLLDLQKASLEKGVAFSLESQQNVKDTTKLYLESQQRFQKMNQTIASQNLEAQQLQLKINDLGEKLSKQGEAAYKAYDEQLTHHDLLMATLQLLVLLPCLAIAVYCFRRYRHTVYSSMITAMGIAIILKITMVMHYYFPSRIFKYLFIIALIILTVYALNSMLRMMVAPKRDWLMKQYREAYQKMRCPMCQFPIQPGVLKLYSERQLQHDTAVTTAQYLQHLKGYACPHCGQQLFETCTTCNTLKRSLLPYCDTCETKKE